MRVDLPAGAVTLLFTDIEGSTKLLHEIGADEFAAALAEHRRLLRAAFAAHGGVEVDTQGDAFFVAFASPDDAVAAAAAAQAALAPGPIRVRMGLHTGTPRLADEGYVGEDVHLGARIAAAGHGGQVLLSGATRALVDTGLSDLGEHRLKDFASAVPIFQLGQERFPPLKTISNTNLPRPASSFVGREREVSEVAALLRSGARLVTLSGPGGSGKTRLAIEAAAELVPEVRAGVFWVALATVRDPALVSDTIERTLGASDGLAAHVGERELLLVLDNLEQVVEAGLELPSLLERCPNLRLLVTSRELLRVRGEVDYPVLPLAEREAVDLFVERSRLAADETVGELCRRLDHLPLAIELAAARATVLSPRQILDRLSRRLDLLRGGRDADPRQQTLRATIEWSYELLGEDERRLFARLGAFTGGCTLESAEEVAEADVDVLQSLVEKSLVRHTGERFWLLETIRGYAVERLDASGEAAALQGRHADHYLALAEAAAPHLPAHDRGWMERLDAEHDNLRGALDVFEELGEAQDALRLAGLLGRFWLTRGHVAEGARRLERLLAADARPTAARAQALTAFSMLGGDEASAADALAIFERLGDEHGAAVATLVLGSAVAATDLASALRIWEEARAHLLALGDDHHALFATRHLAWASISLGDRERGRSLHEENLARARALANERMEASILGALGTMAIEDGDLARALRILGESHALHECLGDPFMLAQDVYRHAFLLAAAGEGAAAARTLGSAEALADEAGVSLRDWDPEMWDEVLRTLGQGLDPTTIDAERAHGRTQEPETAVQLARASLGALPSD